MTQGIFFGSKQNNNTNGVISKSKLLFNADERSKSEIGAKRKRKDSTKSVTLYFITKLWIPVLDFEDLRKLSTKYSDVVILIFMAIDRNFIQNIQPQKP